MSLEELGVLEELLCTGEILASDWSIIVMLPLVLRFLSDGARVAILDLNEEAGLAKIRELEETGLNTEDRVKCWKLDVR